MPANSPYICSYKSSSVYVFFKALLYLGNSNAQTVLLLSCTRESSVLVPFHHRAALGFHLIQKRAQIDSVVQQRVASSIRMARPCLHISKDLLFVHYASSSWPERVAPSRSSALMTTHAFLAR
jgi:hypothetical protein